MSTTKMEFAVTRRTQAEQYFYQPSAHHNKKKAQRGERFVADRKSAVTGKVQSTVMFL